MPKQDFAFRNLILNSAGSLGFYPHSRIPFYLTKLGAFITNPISIKPRKPANQAGLIHYPGGVLLHSGFPNPGFRAAMRKYARRWQRAEIPIVVHLLGEPAAELNSVVRQLEEMDNVIGLEIGLAEGTTVEQAIEITQLALGELPVMVRIPLQRAGELAGAVVEAGANLISLAPPRGTISATNGALVSGRLYGPGLFPMALQAVQTLTAQEIPVVGAGGIYENSQVEEMLRAGAAAVQIDTALWRGFGELEPNLEEKVNG